MTVENQEGILQRLFYISKQPSTATITSVIKSSDLIWSSVNCPNSQWAQITEQHGQLHGSTLEKGTHEGNAKAKTIEIVSRPPFVSRSSE